MSRPRVIAIVPAAGSGKRLGKRERKPFVLLGNKPIVSYALKTLDDCPLIDGIFVASEKACIKKFKRLTARYRIRKVIDIVVGGKTRQESVANCIKRVPPGYQIVLIHDAARPLVDRATIETSIMAAEKFGACMVAVPESDTIKLADNDLFIKKTLDRKKIFRAGTPQVFKYNLIMKAYAAAVALDRFTDDASLVESIGGRVKIVEGPYRNIKITTKEDLKLAEVLLRSSQVKVR